MPDFATTDLTLAIAHHLLIFALAGVLAFEIGVIRTNLTAQDIHRVGRVDLWYGILAAAILIVGFARAVYAAKGWAYYSVNAFFWAKIGTFALVGLLSIAPTIAMIRWRRALAGNPAFLPEPRAIRGVRRFLWLEAMLFALIPVFAAIMARGYSSFRP
jgi:putative membrane protein